MIGKTILTIFIFSKPIYIIQSTLIKMLHSGSDIGFTVKREVQNKTKN